MNTGNEAGKKLENDTEEFLKSKNWPFYKNMKSIPEFEIDFIIPGGIIEVKSTSYCKRKYKAHNKLYKQILRYDKFVPKGTNIWIYVPNADLTSFPDYSKNFKNKIIIINDLNSIEIADYKIYVNYKYLCSLISYDNNNYEKDIYHYSSKIITTKDIYDRLSLFLSDNEKNRLRKFNVRFTSLPRHEVLVTFVRDHETKSRFSGKCFNNFLLKHNVHGLHSRIERKPSHHDKRYTKICPSCLYIMIRKFKFCANCKTLI